MFASRWNSARVARQAPPRRSAAAAPALRMVLSCLTVFTFAAWGGQARLAAAEPQAYFAASIWTGEGPAISDAVLLVQDGKILAVGPRESVEIPANAVRHELGSQVIIPGLVIAGSTFALTSQDNLLSVTPELIAADGFDPTEDYHEALSGGVTTVYLEPGHSRFIQGQGSVVKLHQGDEPLSRMAALSIGLDRASLNPPTFYDPPVGAVSVDRPLEPTRTQLAQSLAGAVSGLRLLLKASESVGTSDSVVDRQLLENLARYRQPGARVFLNVDDAAEIRAAVALARERQWELVLAGPRELDPFYPEFSGWAELLGGVVLRAPVRPGRITEVPVPPPGQPRPDETWVHAYRLIAAGVPVALRPIQDDDLAEMLFLASTYLKGGLRPEQVLAMLTSTPARILGVEERVGSLASGKDADFVVLTAAPFADRSQVVSTFVRGERAYERPSQGSPDASRARVLRAGSVYLGDGQVVTEGAVVVRDGKIESVGTSVTAPLDAELEEYPSAVIVPGFIDLDTKLGVGGELEGSRNVQTRLSEQLFAADPAVPEARRGGVTTVLLHTGTSPGSVVAFKLGPQLRTLKDPVALRFAVQGNLTSQKGALTNALTQGKQYHEQWLKYDQDLAEYQKKLKEYEAAKARYDAAQRAAEARRRAEQSREGEQGETEKKEDKPKEDKPEGGEPEGDHSDGAQPPNEQPERKDAPAEKPEESKDESSSAGSQPAKEAQQPQPPEAPKEPEKPKENAALEPYRALFAKKIPALVEARRLDEQRLAVELFHDQFDVRMVLVGGQDAFREAAPLAEKEIPVIVGPVLLREVDQREVNLPQVLVNAQVPIAFQSQARTGVAQLPFAVQHAVARGLGRTDALRGLTSQAAKLLGLEQQIGSIAAGKDADLVLLSGPPLDPASRVLAVMIDGQWVYRDSE